MQLTLDELKRDNDIAVESKGITILFEKDLEVYLDTAVIDYSDGWFERGFVVRGTSSC